MDGINWTMTGCTVCLMLTLHFTIQLASQHLLSWKKPKEQKAILVIIMMAPLYAIISYIGLIDFLGSKTFFTFLESLKECYEALVMAKFLALMYTYLNISISNNIVPDEIKGREIHHSFPMTLFQPRTVHLNHQRLKSLKYWTWQFVVIRPVCSILMISLQLLGTYPDWVSWTFTIILNISVSLALYSLVIFYHVFAKELAPHQPLAKFLCVKGIVFFCFWQGIALEILAAAGIIKSHHVWFDVEHIQEALQNIFVIVEMVEHFCDCGNGFLRVLSAKRIYSCSLSPGPGKDGSRHHRQEERLVCREHKFPQQQSYYAGSSSITHFPLLSNVA